MGKFPFDIFTHKPPKIDKFGYNKETHKGTELFNQDKPNVLKDGVQIPTWWQGPTKKRGHTNFLNHTISYKEGSNEGSPEKPILRLSATAKRDAFDFIKSAAQDTKNEPENAYTDEPRGPTTLT